MTRLPRWRGVRASPWCFEKGYVCSLGCVPPGWRLHHINKDWVQRQPGGSRPRGSRLGPSYGVWPCVLQEWRGDGVVRSRDQTCSLGCALPGWGLHYINTRLGAAPAWQFTSQWEKGGAFLGAFLGVGPSVLTGMEGVGVWCGVETKCAHLSCMLPGWWAELRGQKTGRSSSPAVHVLEGACWGLFTG
jgi:hypothetical protein